MSSLPIPSTNRDKDNPSNSDLHSFIGRGDQKSKEIAVPVEVFSNLPGLGIHDITGDDFDPVLWAKLPV